MDNEKSNPQQEQARNLYFQAGLTQAQIAEIVGVSQKTVSLWMHDGKWKLLKDISEQTPVVLIEQMACELTEINNVIVARKSGERFATLKEAETRRKIMASIKILQQQQTVGVNAEVLMNFITYVRRRTSNLEELQSITRYADQYLKGEKKMSLKPAFKPYTLPGDMESLPPQA